MRRVRRPSAAAQAHIGGSKVVGAVVILLATTLASAAIVKTWQITPAESYIDSFRVLYELPRGLRQLIKIVGGASGVATLVLVVAVSRGGLATADHSCSTSCRSLLPSIPRGARGDSHCPSCNRCSVAFSGPSNPVQETDCRRCTGANGLPIAGRLEACRVVESHW